MGRALTDTTLRHLDIQGFERVDERALAQVAPWLLLAFGLCAVMAGVGTAMASPMILLLWCRSRLSQPCSRYTGASPTSIAMNPAGTMALAMHIADGSVTVLSISNQQVTVVEKLPIGKDSGPTAAAFNPDGHTMLITRSSDHTVSLFAVEGNRLRTPAIRDMSPGIRPFAVSYCGSTGIAVVSNLGMGTGDADTVSLLDVAAAPPRASTRSP